LQTNTTPPNSEPIASILLIRLGRAISFEASLRLTNPDLFRIQVSESGSFGFGLTMLIGPSFSIQGGPNRITLSTNAENGYRTKQ
jgi:hypothetical protein